MEETVVAMMGEDCLKENRAIEEEDHHRRGTQNVAVAEVHAFQTVSADLHSAPTCKQITNLTRCRHLSHTYPAGGLGGMAGHCCGGGVHSSDGGIGGGGRSPFDAIGSE